MIHKWLLKVLNGHKEAIGIEIVSGVFINGFNIPAGLWEKGVVPPVKGDSKLDSQLVPFRNEGIGAFGIFRKIAAENAPVDVSSQGIVFFSANFKT